MCDGEDNMLSRLKSNSSIFNSETMVISIWTHTFLCMHSGNGEQLKYHRQIYDSIRNGNCQKYPPIGQQINT